MNAATHDFGEDPAVAPQSPEAERLDLKAYALWTRCHDEHGAPSPQEVLAHEDCDFVDHAVLIRIGENDDESPAIAHIGTQLWLGLDGILPQNLAEVPARSVLSRITEHYLQAVANRTPVGFEAEFVNEDGSAIGYHAIALPCAGDGERIDAVLGVVDYSVVASDDEEIVPDNALVLDQPVVTEPDAAMPKEGWRAVIAKMRRDPGEPVDDLPSTPSGAERERAASPAENRPKPRKRQALAPFRPPVRPPEPRKVASPAEPPQHAAGGVEPALAQLLQIAGALAAALVDGDSGMPLASAGDPEAIDLDMAVAGNAEVLRAKRKALRALGMEPSVEDIMITLPAQYHLLRPLTADPHFFLCLVLDREGATLAMARHELRRVERALKV